MHSCFEFLSHLFLKDKLNKRNGRQSGGGIPVGTATKWLRAPHTHPTQPPSPFLYVTDVSWMAVPLPHMYFSPIS